MEEEHIKSVDEDEELEDMKLSALAQHLQRPKSQKEKERRVSDFKQRVSELVDLYLLRSNDSEVFLPQAIRLLMMVRNTQFNKGQSSLVNKCVQLVLKSVQRKGGFQVQYLDQLELCLQETLAASYKCKDQALFSLFKQVIFTIFQLKQGLMTEQVYQDSMASTISIVLQQLARKKTILYDCGFFKEVIKRHPVCAGKTVKVIVQFVNLKGEGGAQDDRVRREFLGILNYLLASDKQEVRSQVAEQLKAYIQTVSRAFANVVSSYPQMTWKKNSLIKEVFTIITQIIKLTNHTQLKQELLTSLESIKVDDKGIESQRVNLVKKIKEIK